MPIAGFVVVMQITDKQFGDIEFYHGKKRTQNPDTPQQLELF
jgi:CRISPR-associated protein Cas2